jgi:hypothetical protein
MTSNLSPILPALVWPGSTVLVALVGITFSGLVLLAGRLWSAWRRPRPRLAPPHKTTLLAPRTTVGVKEWRLTQTSPDRLPSEIESDVETNWR